MNDLPTREQMLAVLKGIKTPIILDPCVSDMGCDFKILTSEKIMCVLGRNWPAMGPFFKIDFDKSEMTTLLKISPDESDAKNIDYSTLSQGLRELFELLNFARRTRDFMTTIVASNIPSGTPFYVYYDDADKALYVFFKYDELLSHFVAMFEGEYGDDENATSNWDDMDDEELEQWCDNLEAGTHWSL